MQIVNRRSPVTATVPCSAEVEIVNAAGEVYLVQVSWPLAWEEQTTGRNPVPVL
jgi:hypothetical protein